MTIFWFALMAGLLIVEFATMGLTAIWFALGALIALIAAAFNLSVWWQILAFIVISAVTLALTRPLAKRFVNSRRKPTNADRLLDMTGIVTEKIDNINAKGTVSISGKLWTARSFDESVIPAGTEVRPLRIDGVKLIVTPLRETADSVSE